MASSHVGYTHVHLATPINFHVHNNTRQGVDFLDSCILVLVFLAQGILARLCTRTRDRLLTLPGPTITTRSRRVATTDGG